jgi:osmotically-inducible protein OsmY
MSGARKRFLVVVPAIAMLATLSLSAKVMPAQKSADAQLKDRIEFGLETSPVVKKYDVKVKVVSGEVILSGDVATVAQKTEAVRLAKVAGATKIQDAIVVDPSEDTTVADRMKGGLNKAGDKITDAWITTKVNWFFLGEDSLKGSHINVDTKDNVVTLKGTVTSTAGRARAVALATDTEGVKRVIDELTISR